MTTEELKRLRELCDAATGGPWSVRSLWHGGFAVFGPPNPLLRADGKPWKNGKTKCDVANTDEDNAFIAASRTALPALLDEVEKLRRDYLTVADAVARSSTSAEDLAAQARATRQELETLSAEYRELLGRHRYITGLRGDV